MPLMGGDLTLGTYVDVLRRLRVIVAAWETHLAANSHWFPASFIAERNRLPLIIRDLEVLSVSGLDAGRCEIPSLRGRAELMGAMYVMEGSRLGGQLIARHVEKVLGLEPGHGTCYFRGFGNETGRMWTEFLERLRDIIPEEETQDVIAGAKKMFGAFGDWMTSLTNDAGSRNGKSTSR